MFNGREVDVNEQVVVSVLSVGISACCGNMSIYFTQWKLHRERKLERVGGIEKGCETVKHVWSPLENNFQYTFI